MKKENETLLSEVVKQYKEKALADAASHVVQLKYARDMVQEQYDALPELADDASDDDKKARAAERVKIDAHDSKLNTQIEFYRFIVNS